MTAAKAVNLALQGGGAHGAFTWGVLDRLLEEERLEFPACSATSAGAMNAAMLKTGFSRGGREGARRLLDRFWGRIVDHGRTTTTPVLEWVRMVNPSLDAIAGAIESSPAVMAGDAMMRMFSPYDFNPLDLNPLRELLVELLDFDCVCATDPPRLFVAATNVRTGKIKVFQGQEISVDAILASACLPTLYRAVEIEDPATGAAEAYWDGGYMGNPPLYPLFYETATPDVVIVHINPIHRDETPTTAREIQNRINEISFNATLLRELRAIDFVTRLIESGRIGTGTMMNVNVHAIADDETMRKLSVATKMQADETVVAALKAAGRRAADRFLRSHWADIGARGTVDLRAMFA